MGMMTFSSMATSKLLDAKPMARVPGPTLSTSRLVRAGGAQRAVLEDRALGLAGAARRVDHEGGVAGRDGGSAGRGGPRREPLEDGAVDGDDVRDEVADAGRVLGRGHDDARPPCRPQWSRGARAGATCRWRRKRLCVFSYSQFLNIGGKE